MATKKNAKIAITVFSKVGGPLTKHISLAKDGSVIPDGSACVMSEGTAQRVVVSNVEQFANVIGGLRSCQAIALGTLRDDLHDQVKIVSRAKLNGDAGVIARIKDNIVYRKGEPALALIDFDKKGMPDEIGERIGDAFWDVLIEVVPALRGAARVMRRSTSAGLYHGDKELPSSGGWHGYIAISDGSDSERFLYTLHDRCWLKGFGWWWISKAGTPLERSIIDRSVFSSERLVFEGPPILGKGLRQDAEKRRPIPYAGDILDTRVACPSLTSAERDTVDKMKADAKERLQPEIDKARAAYVEEKAEELVKRTGVSKAEAIKAIESQCDGVLCEHVVLEFSDKKLKGCTVGDVLDDPESFQNKSLADPIEGVAYGRTTAKVLLRRDNSYPWIKSYAHGGKGYTLVRKPGDELKLDFPGRIPDYAKKPFTSENEPETGSENKSENKGSKPTSKPSPLTELNDKYCVVMEGGKVRVLTFSRQHNREMVNYLTFTDFRNLFMNRFVVVGQDKAGNNITEALGSHWLKHPQRRQYEGVIFEPGEATPANMLNLWRGWGVEPKQGDWSLMQQHILEVLAAGDSEHADYILNFAAWCVQNPGIPAEVALVFKGPEGTGRGIFGRSLCRIFGQHAHQISSIKHLTGDFNLHLRDCCLLFADEAFWPGYRNQEGTLKRLVTEDTLFIEPKGINAFEVKNMLHLVMASNNEWVIPASMDARRFMMLEVAEHKKQDPAWFKPLYKQMDDGGYEAMLYDLLHRDLGDWHPRQIIRTDALHIQQMISLDSLNPFDAWWYALLGDGILPGYQGYKSEEQEQKDGTTRTVMVAGDPNPRRAFSKLLFQHAREIIPKLKFESDNALGHALRDRGCTSFNREGRGWEFPPLTEARAAWKEKVQVEIDWEDDLDDWQEREEAPERGY